MTAEGEHRAKCRLLQWFPGWQLTLVVAADMNVMMKKKALGRIVDPKHRQEMPTHQEGISTVSFVGSLRHGSRSFEMVCGSGQSVVTRLQDVFQAQLGPFKFFAGKNFSLSDNLPTKKLNKNQLFLC